MYFSMRLYSGSVSILSSSFSKQQAESKKVEVKGEEMV